MKHLINLLHKEGHHGVSASVEDLMTQIGNFCPWYPEEGNFKLSDWDKIGNKLHKDPVAPVKIIHIWHVCWDVISKITNPLLAQSLTNLPTVPQILPPSKPTYLHENRNNPPAYAAHATLPMTPSPLSPPPPRWAVQQMFSDVMAQGSPEDVAATLPLMSVCPVVHNN